MNRSRSYYRDMREKHIKRKKKLAYWWHNPFDGMYSKGKVHCSCPMCSSKTNLKKHGKYRSLGNWSFSCGGKCYTHQDAKRISAMDQDLEGYSSQVEEDGLLNR